MKRTGLLYKWRKSGISFRILPFYVIFFFLSLPNEPLFCQNQQTVPEAFIQDLKQRTFQYFWEIVDMQTWQNYDRYPTGQFTSIAATGFALTSYVIGAENGYVTREEAADRVTKVLSWLAISPQGTDPTGIAGYKGFYYHFLNYNTGSRYKQVELSTMDTGLLMAGILVCQSYFDRESPREEQIRQLADFLYLRVEWDWALNEKPLMSMGWHPETGFLSSVWQGYNEAMILVILALGSPSHSIPNITWDEWCKTYEWSDFYGFEHVNFSPLFGHQYSQMFIDFRGIQDPYMADKGIDYFENSRRATLANRAYCIDNPQYFEGYGVSIWGLTASDGPANETTKYKNQVVRYFTYMARGASSREVIDDGTLAPTAAGGSIPFAPEQCLETLYAMKTKFGSKLYQEYGFKDAFNLSYATKGQSGQGWFNPDYLGIDQGPILIQLENYQSGLIWKLMIKNKYIVEGLRKAKFKGGWLDE